MLTPNDIADRLEALARERFPGEEVHRELTPQGFTRPCTLIVQDACKGDVSFGTGTVELRPTFTLTTYVETDEYHHSHLPELHRRQMALVGLLLPGYVRVGDRAPKVSAITMDGGYDFDTVTVTFAYTLDRKDFTDTPRPARMERLHLNEEEI